jgi:hypothetical protein
MADALQNAAARIVRMTATVGIGTTRAVQAPGVPGCIGVALPCIEVRRRIAVVMWLQTASIPPGGGARELTPWTRFWCGYKVGILPSVVGLARTGRGICT